MIRFLIRKLPSVLLVTFVSSVIAFALPRVAPGDPVAVLTEGDISSDAAAALRAEMGLDLPLWQQYLKWIGNVLEGDLGTSYLLRRPVSELVLGSLESTIELTVLAVVIMVAVGLGIGLMGGSPISKLARAFVDTFNTVFLAVPPFLTGLLLILLLGITFRVLPVSGEVAFLSNPEIGIQYLILPAVALALPQAAVIARLLQTSMLATRGEDFVDLAKAKGVPPARITYRHVARNSLGTAVVVIGLRIGDLLGGALIVEAIFARNGLGALMVSGVQSRDYQLVQFLILAAVVVAVIIQLLSEITLATLDPRIRLEGS
ncbi:ABC transporter permease [Streptosporangium canum]|uniref:ABC transporter permease n=1 Tax=Streptosporangium canum TaxID=324952 RepID=UPI003675E984